MNGDNTGRESLDRVLEARERGRAKGEDYRKYMHGSVTGLEVGVSIALGAILGAWVDRRFGVRPYGMLGGVVLGAAYAVKTLSRLTKGYLSQPAPKPTDDDSTSEAGNDG